MAKPKTSTNTAPVDDQSAFPSGEGFEDEQTGFPPYWNPSEGRKFYGRIMARDERDPEFVRYVVQASCKHVCRTGPADDATDCEVQTGENFTVSEYASLPLADYFGLEVLVTALKKRPIKGGKQDVWIFKLQVAPQTKALLMQRRAAQIQAKQNSASLPAGA
jgi:hypothetical protein